MLTFEQFILRIIESGILTEQELSQFQNSLPADRKTEDLTIFGRELIRSKKITRFQIGMILKGRHQMLSLANNLLLERIGAGGMGQVYLAEHQRMKRRTAVKILNQAAMESEVSVMRFQREVQTAAQLIHPNIVTAYDAGEERGYHFLVMEYVKGDNLDDLVELNGPIHFTKAVDYIRQAAQGLQYAHTEGVIHRDIKPSNLLLRHDGIVKVLDMGLARGAYETLNAAPTGLTEDHQIVGTVEFMSPEQADEVTLTDHRSDIYSLGCTLFYLIAGKSPFDRGTMLKTLMAHRNEKLPRLRDTIPEIPAELDRVLGRMMAKDPENRTQTMSDVVRQLKGIGAHNEFDILDEDFEEEEDTREFGADELLGDANLANSAADSTVDPISTKDTKEESESGASTRTLTEHAVGIDLGTTYSAVSYLDDLGRPVTLANAEGEKITPSVVLLDGDDIIVGKEAVKAMSTEMEMIAECAKRDLGQMNFHKIFEGRKFRPEVLLAFILQKLKGDAEEQIGNIKRAVITVPAYFDEVRRNATIEAGKLACLEVMDIINEPTSAAVAYGYNQALLQTQSKDSHTFLSRPQRILVYDLGGGTFDVTVMEIENSQYTTLATDGDVELGGRDWDQRLLDYCAKVYMETFGEDPRQDPNSLGRLLREVEDAKRTLSSRRKASVSVEFHGIGKRVEITRDKFEQLTQDLLSRTEFTTRQTLKAANLTWKDIDRVLLVGGSTRMPAVAQSLENLSGIKPDRSVAPDEAVAHGAAIRAGMLMLAEKGEPLSLNIRNVNSHSLGVIAKNPKTGNRQTGILIPRNSQLPATIERVFRTHKDDQNSILVQIVEGESKNPLECSQVGKCIVHNLPKGLPARTPIKVIFQYDENGRLTVTVKVSGIELKQQITRENKMSDDEVAHWQKVVAGELELSAS